MKLDRLIGILTVLLQNNRVTAPQLAEKFEVTRRTIGRDIDALCQAGIPIVTHQGGGGGISIAEGYKLDKSILTSDELSSIIAALKGIGSISEKTQVERTLDKLAANKDAVVSLQEPIVIDLASHYKGSLTPKIKLIKQAVLEQRLIEFDYYYEKGQTHRRIEPYFVIFQWTAWYRDTQPGQNVYWNGFGDPPSLTFRAEFNDIEFNRKRQNTRELIKGRFVDGNLGWIMVEDLELFAALYRKPLDKPSERQQVLLELIEREGPLNIQQMKEFTGMLVKEITPALHRLQEAFLIYEDQYDGEWDRSWYKFTEMFPDIDLARYSRQESLKILLQRYAYRNVLFDADMVKSFYKLPGKDIKAAIDEMVTNGVFTEMESSYLLKSDLAVLQSYSGETPKFVLAMHRNDFLVKSNEHWMKEQFKHPEHDTLQYLLIDGEFRGASVGHFKNGPYVLEDIILDLPKVEITARKDEILETVYAVNFGQNNPIKRYNGEDL